MMLAETGTLLVGMALITSAYAAWATFWGIRRDDIRWVASGWNGAFAAAGLLGGALLALLAGFLGDQFQLRYVVLHSSRDLPRYLKASAVWAGQEGSLLLWAFLQALFAALVARRVRRCTHFQDRWISALPGEALLAGWATFWLCLIAACFAGVTLLSNPFSLSVTTPFDGQALNPLLRHPAMVFHPPALYLGYVGLAVPYAFALAGLVTGRLDEWPAAARRWTLAAWLFLGLGILLGARWAYDVLGWGGYWGWDPVENAGLMPWLTATALVHATAMQNPRGTFRWWNVVLAVLSFALVLFGTFTTRSGLIQSLHAFAYSERGLIFLASFGLVLVLPPALGLGRRPARSHEITDFVFFSRAGMTHLTIILLLLITASVFAGTVLPSLIQALGGQRLEIGPAWFELVTGPQLALLALVMGVCPLLGRSVVGLGRLGARVWPALAGAAVLPVLGALLGFTRPISLLGFAVLGLAGAVAIAEVARSGGRGSSGGSRRRLTGAGLVHAGVVLMALGVIGTRTYSAEAEVLLSLGEPATVEGYTLRYEEVARGSAGDHSSTWVPVQVSRNGRFLTTLRPRVDQYPNLAQEVRIPALRTGLREDLYLVLSGWDDDDSRALLKVFVNPLAGFLWFGGLVILIGGAMALWPAAWPTRRVSSVSVRRAVKTGLVLAVTVCAGVAVWGRGCGAPVPAAGQSLVGQEAPEFSFAPLDGSMLTLSDLRGRVVVVNFWATWCPSCVDELPELQAVWEEYQQQDVLLVGIAVQEDLAEVQQAVSQFRLTYPVGLGEETLVTAYGIPVIPTTVLVDQEGVVASVGVGPMTAEDLGKELDRILLAPGEDAKP
jgi:cytochrome c-type biogenesis protein CcmF